MFGRKRDVVETIAIKELMAVMASQRAELESLRAQVTKIDAAQESLSGRFYRLKLHKLPSEDDPPPEPVRASKAEVLRARFTPGRPARHD